MSALGHQRSFRPILFEWQALDELRTSIETILVSKITVPVTGIRRLFW